MSRARAAVLATAITGVVSYALAQWLDFTIDQAVASHITTIVTTLIALFMPPPSGGAPAVVHVSPRTAPGDAVEVPQIFEEEITQ